MGGWVSLVLGNLAQSAHSPPVEGEGFGGWVAGWLGVICVADLLCFPLLRLLFGERAVFRGIKKLDRWDLNQCPYSNCQGQPGVQFFEYFNMQWIWDER